MRVRASKNKIKSDIELHLFVCTNERTNKNKSCGKSGSLIFYKYLKQRMKSISEKYSKVVKVNSTSCLSKCSEGPVAVSYPEGDWFSIESTSDIDVLVTNLERSWLQELSYEKKNTSHA